MPPASKPKTVASTESEAPAADPAVTSPEVGVEPAPAAPPADAVVRPTSDEPASPAAGDPDPGVPEPEPAPEAPKRGPGRVFRTYRDEAGNLVGRAFPE